MGKIKYNSEYGWYGTCGFNECEDYYLSHLKDNRNNVDSIIRTRSAGDATGYEKFTCYDNDKPFAWNNLIGSTNTFDDYFNLTFDKLECGRAYLVNTNTKRNNLSEYEIEGLNTFTGESFVSSNCSDVLEVPCTEDDYEEISVLEKEFKIQNNISISNSEMLGGTFSIPKRTENSGYLPYVIQVKITTSAGDKHLATITYNGEGPGATSTLYFKDSGGTCYNGKILNQDGVRTCVLDSQ